METKANETDDLNESVEEGSFDKFMDEIVLREHRAVSKKLLTEETPARAIAKKRSEHPTRKITVKR